MRRLFMLWGISAGILSAVSFAFGADIGGARFSPSSAIVQNSAENLRDEILRHVRDDALTAPENPEACAYALSAWQNVEEVCSDPYAQRFSAAEVALLDEEENAPVFGEMRETIGIIRFSAFGKDTDENFMKRALALLEQGAKELRLDLRDNHGGSVGVALKILYLFAEERDRLATFRYRARTEIYDVASMKTKFALWHQPGILRKIPTIVLINGESVSASELVASAMKDWGYPVRGTISYGKGTGHDFFELPDGSFVRLTTFEFFAGNSQMKIRGIGVVPNAPLPEEVRE